MNTFPGKGRAPAIKGLIAGIVMVLTFSWSTLAIAQSIPIAAGYRDYNYGTYVNSEPTGEKPESKLWWHDGRWWGSLWDPSTNTYSIRYLDLASQSWIDTGVPLDDRRSSKADALWDGSKLYLVSHHDSGAGEPAEPEDAGRLYRLSYDENTKAFSLDGGFPVEVNASRSETLVLDKDSLGKLWITWVESGQVMINCSQEDDLTWGVPFALPVQGSPVSDDDIASIIHFDDDKIGVIWSNQLDRKTYFACRNDGEVATLWENREEALADPAGLPISDDHLNVKTACDGSGNIYAVAKTGLGYKNSPRVFLLKRSAAGVWSQHVFGTKAEKHTRPQVVIDAENRQLYVLARSTISGKAVIYYKKTSLDVLQFDAGVGIPFIESADDFEINNVTSTKQCLDSTTDLVALACDEDSHYYFHNYIDLRNDNLTTESFAPVADVFVKTTAPDKNFNNLPSLKAMSDGEINNIYLKFEVSGLSGTVTNARLRLYVINASDAGGSAYAVSNEYFGSSSAWQEHSLVWNNAPTIGGSPLGTAGPAGLDTWVEIDVTAAITADGTYSFALTSNSTDFVRYSSREGSNAPVLIVTTTSEATNQPPVAGDDFASTNHQSPVMIEVLNNDTDADGNLDSSSVTVVLPPARGEVTAIDPITGAISFTPASGYVGMDSLRYTVRDDDGLVSNAALVLIEVTDDNLATWNFAPAADVFVKTTAPSKNFNHLPSLKAMSDGEINNIYLKFEVNGLSGAVTNARLRLYVINASDAGGSIYSVSNDYLNSTTAWEENSLVWNNAPTIAGSPLSTAGVAELDSWLEFDVTGVITGDGTFSFGLASNSTNFVRYDSREGPNPPELVITTALAKAGELAEADSQHSNAAPPVTLQLLQNYPNPFNAQTTISYALAQPAEVKLVIFDQNGQHVRRLVGQYQPAGNWRAIWDGKTDRGSLAVSGTYWYRLTAGGEELTRKLVLLK